MSALRMKHLKRANFLRRRAALRCDNALAFHVTSTNCSELWLNRPLNRWRAASCLAKIISDPLLVHLKTLHRRMVPQEEGSGLGRRDFHPDQRLPFERDGAILALHVRGLGADAFLYDFKKLLRK
jgi:hypothetical protein